ncbi:hypothetical protein D9M71_693890 [compost metagenome]
MGDHFHGIGRQGRIHTTDQREVLANELAGNIALGQRQGFSGQVIQGPGAVRRQARHQHRRAGQERPGKQQVILTQGTEADTGQHIDLAALDRLHHLRH